MTTFTRVTLITGSDAKGNEYFYFKSGGDWIDGYNECRTSPRYIAIYIVPSVVKVRFGDVEMSAAEWQMSGCPLELTSEELNAWRAVKAEA